MKIHILTAVWKRPEITRICFEGIKRLQQSFDIEATAVCSEPVPLCKEYRINFVYAPNKPLGRKWNTGLNAIKADYDYLMILGSDDLISDSTVSALMEFMKQGYYLIGIKDLYLYSGGKVKYFAGYNMSIGAGRCIKKQIVDELGMLWDNRRNRGLDGSMLTRIRAHGYDEHVIKGTVLDIKSEVNINSFDSLKGKEVDDSILGEFGERETKMLREL